METFWLGVHRPGWLTDADVPMFVSRRVLAGRRRLPRATHRWALDGGGYTELSLYGRWTVTPNEYIAEVRRLRDEVGLLEWAAPMDWMVEPHILAKTGGTVASHQAKTVANYVELMTKAPDLPFIPVIQGWELGDYIRHVEDYDRAGIDLRQHPVVGVGSVCRRQRMTDGRQIAESLSRLGIKLHGFGVKITGLLEFGHLLVSADSMAWSFRARRGGIQLPGCTHRHCANCKRWALAWRQNILRAAETPKQTTLPWS